MWKQIYDPLGGVVISALVAAIPLFVLLYMLAVKKAKGYWAAAAGLGSALVLAIALWGMPVKLAALSTLLGSAVGLFPIVWIVIAAIWIYNMTVETGEFEVVKYSLACITEDRRLQAIFIAFAFGSFIEGTAGFGTPVAITAAMLTGLGFNPLYAASICLIANTAPVAFGALGIPIITIAKVTGLDVMKISAITGRQLPFLTIIVPLWVTVTMCGWSKALEVLPAILIAGFSFALGQFLSSNYLGPELPDVISSIMCIISLVLFLRVWKPPTIWRFEGEDPNAQAAAFASCKYTGGDIVRAWAPWVILAVVVLLWGDAKVTGIKLWLDKLTMPVVWEGLDKVVARMPPIVKAEAPYAAVYTFNWLSSAGTGVFVAGILSIFVLPGYGIGKAIACFGRTLHQLRFPIITIAMILGLAFLMNYSGMSSTLGLAFAATGAAFAFFSPLIGWVGVFLTGSDTSSNALFGNLQATTAQQVGMAPELACAANSSGGVTGKMISPQSISVATAASNMVGKEGDIFRFTCFHSIAMALVICVITYLQAGVLKWMLP